MALFRAGTLLALVELLGGSDFVLSRIKPIIQTTQEIR
jgi:hypothetical protein